MKTIYLDTEFSEGFFKPISWLPKWFPGNKPRWSIELISIGLVDDQGKEYYAINKDYKYSRCNKWVRENVLTKLPDRLLWIDKYFDHYAPNPVYKSIDEIREGIMAFVNPSSGENTLNNKSWNNHLNKYKVVAAENTPLQFKAYYADYDWVLFCTIFGTMDQLPAGFPMYCIDIKQELDKKVASLDWYYGRDIWSNMNNRSVGTIAIGDKQIDDYPATFEQKLTVLQELKDYPKQADEHSSISDARFNKQLDEFIATL